jgi:hypothetical protein
MRTSLTMMVALRESAAPFWSTVSVRAVSPCPLSGDTRSQGASLVAVHEHSRAALTVADSCPPLEGTGEDGELIVA